MSFISALEKIGKEFAKGLTWAVSYAVPVEKLAALLFPSAAPTLTAVVTATTLIQNAVADGSSRSTPPPAPPKGTGTQKPWPRSCSSRAVAVTSLLAAAGIQADTEYIQKLVSAVVSILNVQG